MKYIFPAAILFLAASCQPTKIIQSWKAENVQAKKYNKILVISVAPVADTELQHKIENHLADDLRAMGQLAIAANKVFAPGTFVKGDTAKAKEVLERNGFDGLLTAVLTEKKSQPYYIPGRAIENDKQAVYKNFDMYMSTMADKIYVPGTYGTETKYVWENSFYDLRNQQLLYTARTRSFDFTSKTILAHTYGQLMAYDLIKKKILRGPESER